MANGKEIILGDLAIESIARLTRAAEIKPMGLANGTVPFIVIPEGYKAEYLEKCIYNDHAAAPERIKTSLSVVDADSFIEYHKLFHDVNTRIFADEASTSILAILDYHGPGGEGVGGPRWGNHKLTLKLEFSPEWGVWTGQNGKEMDQMAFAEFLEQNSVDIIEPQAAAVVDMARELEGKTEANFGGAARTQSGNYSFTYTEQTTTKAGSNKVDVPDRFRIKVPIFFGGDRIELEALLRYRVKDARLKFFYTLVRSKEAIHKAFLNERGKIAVGTSATIINGKTA